MHKPTGNRDMLVDWPFGDKRHVKSLRCFGTAAMFVLLPDGHYHLITLLERSKAFFVCNSVQVCLCNRLL